ncbi:MAG: extracellular solute-binding protein family 1, partial [Chloroflexi bacterium]|nr:extracellular solute-binding protein family 1 [Chloroflexota bacterium]
MHEGFDYEPVYDEFYQLCAGRTTRAKFMKRAAQLGLTATAIGAFLKAYNPATATSDIAAAEAAPAAATGVANLGFYSWILNFNPQIAPLTKEYNAKYKDAQVKINVAPTTAFSTQKFLLEARRKTSSWDVYVGMTPFVEMAQMQAAGALEPWDAYMPASVRNDMPMSVQQEGMINGKMYDWPMLLDISSLQWRKSMFKQAGITKVPTTWEEFTDTAHRISAAKLRGGQVSGATFDWHPWRSIMPVVHSISLDVYTKEGYPNFKHPAYAQAYKILKGIVPYAPKDFFSPGTAVEAGTVDEIAMKANRVAMIFKYANTTVHAAPLWGGGLGISDMGLARLPKPAAGGAGGSVFWDTGSGLFKYGSNKHAVANWLTVLLSDERFWTKEVVSSGQIPPFNSIYAKIKGKVPDWIYPAHSQLAVSKAIPNSVYGFSLGFGGVMGPPFLDFLKGKMTAEQALAKASTDFQTQLSQQT